MTKDAASSSSAPNGYVRSDVSNGIGRIEFFHPKSNALPSAVLRDLAAAVTAVGADPAARVIVLQSGGTGPFCAGASFDELTAINNAEQGQEFFSGFARVILAMIRAPQFVISRVHGKAAGGLARDAAQARDYRALGYSVIAMGSDRGLLAQGMRQCASQLRDLAS
jgi:methylglutaconyl-CoA hydratase